MTKVAVFGAGSWGTAFSIVLADAGNDVTIWGRRPEVCDQINSTHENADYFPGIELPEAITATHDPEKAAAGAEFIVFAMPSQTFRGNVSEWGLELPDDAVFVSLMKGIELGTTKRMSEVICEVTGAGLDRVAVLSGPNLAREIAEEQPAATVIACTDTERAEALQAACHTRYFRPYTNPDMVGCELGGAVKNVIALASLLLAPYSTR